MRDEAAGKLTLIHHAAFNTLEENIEAVQLTEKAGAELVLLGYPANFYAKSEKDIYDYTKAFCDATNLGVILFPVPHWGFERIHPAGMDPELVKKMVKDIPNIVCIKAEAGMPTPAGFVEAWKNHAHEVIVTCPLEADAIPFMGFVPMQFSGTSNTGYFGDVVPKMFNFARDGKFDEAMKLYWQIHPARMAQKAAGNSYMPGTSVINRADYEFNAHVPFAMKEGVTQAQIDAMRADKSPEGFTAADNAVQLETLQTRENNGDLKTLFDRLTVASIYVPNGGKDLDAKKVALSDHLLRKKMDDLLDEARNQIEAEAKK